MGRCGAMSAISQEANHMHGGGYLKESQCSDPVTLDLMHPKFRKALVVHKSNTHVMFTGLMTPI